MDDKRLKELKRAVDQLMKDKTPEEVDAIWMLILNSHSSSHVMNTESNFYVVQDDCDGDQNQRLELTALRDGDFAIRTRGPYEGACLRFRTSIGGTMSPNVWLALRVLALAMHCDSERMKKRFG